MTRGRRGSGLRPAAVLVLAAVAAGTLVGVCARTGPARPEAAAEASPAEPVLPAVPVDTQAPGLVAAGRTVGPGENLALVLAALDLPPGAAQAAGAALALTDFDFQRLMPGDSVTLLRRDSLPVALRYHVDLATWYEVRFAPDTVLAERVTAPVETTVVALVGAVRGSLWQSLLEAGADDRLTASYTCILRHHLPRLRDMHPGDSFELVVERLAVADSFYGFGNVHALRYRGAVDVRAYHHARPDGLAFYCDPDGRSLGRVLDYPPIPGARRTSDFGPRLHPVVRRRIRHNGLDYEAPYGTPVRAVADGTVIRAQARRGFGRVVDLEHPGLGLVTRYAHLSRYAVGPGAAVRRGDTIGRVGSTGLSSGAHLHFETLRDGRPLDPLDALPSGYRQVEPEDRAGFEEFKADCRAVAENARPAGERTEGDAE